MNDTVPFQVTCAIQVDDSNCDKLVTSLSGVLDQTVPFTKLVLLDITLPGDKRVAEYYDIKLEKNKDIYSRAYKKIVGKPTKFAIEKTGFDYVKDKKTPKTCLYFFITADYYLKPDFMHRLREHFNKHRYVSSYRFFELTKEIPKSLSDFAVYTCQTVNAHYTGGLGKDCNDFLNTVFDSGSIDLPWIKETIMNDVYVELI